MADVRRIGRRTSGAMAIYRGIWAWLVTVVGLLAVLTAYVLRPTDQFVAVAVTGLSLGACAGCLFDLREENVTVRSMVVFGLSGSAGMLALLGLGALFGFPAVVGGVLWVVLSPWSISTGRRLLGRWLGWDSPEAPAAAAPVPDTPARNMDDAALLKAWRASSAALGSVVSDTDWFSLARRRQDYLNELERRDPRGFAAWLATSPDMDDDPASFFHKSTPDSGAEQ